MNARMIRRRVALVAVLALSFLGACGGGDDDSDGAPGDGAAAVTVEGSSFKPSSVSVKVGDTVTWTFKDSFDHTVTADDKSFDSGTKKSGDAPFEHTFATAGSFTYKCAIHPSMTGTVTVT